MQGTVVWLHSLDQCGLIQQNDGDCLSPRDIYFAFDQVKNIAMLAQGAKVQYSTQQVTIQGKTCLHATDVVVHADV